jgi:hypothetical protein
LEFGTRLLWQTALPAGIYLSALVALTFTYRDKKLLRFLAPFALIEVYLLVVGSLMYTLSEAVLGEISALFLFALVGSLAWLVVATKPTRAPAALLALLVLLQALIAIAVVNVRDS